jgi:hypothetical protein
MASGTEGSPATGPGKPAAPDVPHGAARGAALGFGLLSRLRRKRVFHPIGVGYTGTLTVDRPHTGYPGVPLLEQPGQHPVLFRFSRGAGLPEPLPDVLGLSFRLPDVHGRGRHQDFLLVTSADAPLLHHLLLPARGFFGSSFSSVLAYRFGEAVRLVGARPVTRPARQSRGALRALIEAADAGAARFELTLAALAGRGSPIGELTVGERISDEDAERLAFTPWNTGGGIEPTGPFMGLRRAAYRGSQAGRGLSEGQIP